MPFSMPFESIRCNVEMYASATRRFIFRLDCEVDEHWKAHGRRRPQKNGAEGQGEILHWWFDKYVYQWTKTFDQDCSSTQANADNRPSRRASVRERSVRPPQRRSTEYYHQEHHRGGEMANRVEYLFSIDLFYWLGRNCLNI